MFGMMMPRARGTLPGIAWANTPILLCAFWDLPLQARCGWEDRTGTDELAPARADANKPLPLSTSKSKAFLFLTPQPSRGYGSADPSSSCCTLNFLSDFLVAPPKSPSTSSFLLLFSAPPPGSLNCLWIKLHGECQVLSTTDMVSL